jgi:hypothetical protein
MPRSAGNERGRNSGNAVGASLRRSVSALVRPIRDGPNHAPVWKSDGDHEPHEFRERSFSDLPSFSGLGREDRERCSSFLSALLQQAVGLSDRVVVHSDLGGERPQRGHGLALGIDPGSDLRPAGRRRPAGRWARPSRCEE